MTKSEMMGQSFNGHGQKVCGSNIVDSSDTTDNFPGQGTFARLIQDSNPPRHQQLITLASTRTPHLKFHTQSRKC